MSAAGQALDEGTNGGGANQDQPMRAMVRNLFMQHIAIPPPVSGSQHAPDCMIFVVHICMRVRVDSVPSTDRVI